MLKIPISKKYFDVCRELDKKNSESYSEAILKKVNIVQEKLVDHLMASTEKRT